MAALAEAARFDAALQTEADNLNAALAQAEESARTLRDYLDSLEADPEALEAYRRTPVSDRRPQAQVR